ncbi:MAG: hypothetical protein AB1801_29490, partial [Chloroflexota bacterium]
MTEQSGIETTLGRTLRVLVQQVGLTPEEAAQLRLAHLHLAGKSPNISFTPEGSDSSKTVELDLEAHRALVGWLVARPDSKGDFLFPGRGDEPLDALEIQRLIDRPAQTEAGGAETRTAAAEPEKPPLGAPDETMISSARPIPPPSRPMPPPAPSRPIPPISRPEPPPSRPEMGPPPPAMDATRVSPFRPAPSPRTAPEVDESVNIPLPTSAPKPPGPSAPQAKPPGPEPEQAQPTPPAPPAVTADSPSPVEPTPAPQPAEGPPATERAVETAGRVSPGPPPAPKVTAEAAAAKSKRPAQGPSVLPRWLIWGSAGILMVLCVVCLGGGYLISQTGPGSQLLALVGLPGGDSGVEEATEEPAALEELPATAAFGSPFDSPLPTPTLPPTATVTPAPTETPTQPTDTPTPIPTDTPAVPPTETPSPTATPAPTDTAATEEPLEPPTPVEPPTPSMKYAAPVPVEPVDEFAFIQGNTL